jgi:hypothetical protein
MRGGSRRAASGTGLTGSGSQADQRLPSAVCLSVTDFVLSTPIKRTDPGAIGAIEAKVGKGLSSEQAYIIPRSVSVTSHTAGRAHKR